jgi:hypothetical protein
MTVYRYKNYLVRISTTKRVLTGFSTKIKIKKITEHIKNISERNVKGNKELTFIMILPLQMFDITQYLTKIKCHQFIVNKNL